MKASKRQIGDTGENLAKNYLMDKGYKILETNYFGGYGAEIDIIAQKDSRIIFIEVKTISTNYLQDEFNRRINYHKVKSIKRAARSYLYSKHFFKKNYSYAFDYIFIFLKFKKIFHYKNIFT